MTQLFFPVSSYGLVATGAAIDAGIVPDDDRRILVLTDPAAIPETAPRLSEEPHLRQLRERFTEVVSLNAFIAPTHPTRWQPNPEDAVVIGRLLAAAWQLGDEPPHLFLQSIQAPPARTIAGLFPGAEITIIGDGLMTYSPIRSILPVAITGRVTTVAYPDVVPGVEPLLFRESGAVGAPIAADIVRQVLDTVDRGTGDPVLDALAEDGWETALVCGQYLAQLGLLSEAEESKLHRELIDAAYIAGANRVVFKPHPAAGATDSAALARHAAGRGVAFEVYRGAVPAEIVASRLGVARVVAGFSTVLPTVAAVYGVPISSVGMDTLLERLQPYENSNRIPATIVDALTRSDPRYRDDADALQSLIDAVGYVMQPRILAETRPRAEEFIARAPEDDLARYFPGGRLADLRLDGRADRVSAGVRRAAAGRTEEAILVLRGARRRAARAWQELRGR